MSRRRNSERRHRAKLAPYFTQRAALAYAHFNALDAIPMDEMALMRDLEAQYGSLYDKASYGL
jgi:hypothetical protein